jgi:plastocyanin
VVASIIKLISLFFLCGSLFGQGMPMDHSNHAMPMDHSNHAMPMDHENHMMPMMMTEQTLVMNQNISNLPNGCEEISEQYFYNIKAGAAFASDEQSLFGFSTHELNVTPCSQVQITFKNEDQVRHQLMIHGLPRYLYPQGMFHLEANGGASVTGTFIVPLDNQTYLIHCDLSRHAELGMKAQLVVGSGGNDIPGIPTISGQLRPDLYLDNPLYFIIFGVFLVILACMLLVFVSNRKK